MKFIYIFLFALIFCKLSLGELTAEFVVTPEDFSLGSQFTAKCKVSGFDSSKYFSYSADFYLNPSDSRILRKNPRIDFDLAKWTVMKSSIFFSI